MPVTIRRGRSAPPSQRWSHDPCAPSARPALGHPDGETVAAPQCETAPGRRSTGAHASRSRPIWRFASRRSVHRLQQRGPRAPLVRGQLTPAQRLRAPRRPSQARCGLHAAGAALAVATPPCRPPLLVAPACPQLSAPTHASRSSRRSPRHPHPARGARLPPARFARYPPARRAAASARPCPGARTKPASRPSPSPSPSPAQKSRRRPRSARAAAPSCAPPCRASPENPATSANCPQAPSAPTPHGAASVRHPVDVRLPRVSALGRVGEAVVNHADLLKSDLT